MPLVYAGMCSHAPGAGQGGFEIRTYIATAAAGAGRGTVHFYAPIPIFAVGCTIADIDVN